jgi:hypothetical protein
MIRRFSSAVAAAAVSVQSKAATAQPVRVLKWKPEKPLKVPDSHKIMSAIKEKGHMTNAECMGRLAGILKSLEGIQDQIDLIGKQMQIKAGMTGALKHQEKSLLYRFNKIGSEFEELVCDSAKRATEADAFSVFVEHGKIFSPSPELHAELTSAWIHRFGSIDATLSLFNDVTSANLFVPQVETVRELLVACSNSFMYKETKEMFVYMLQTHMSQMIVHDFYAMLRVSTQEMNLQDSLFILSQMKIKEYTFPCRVIANLLTSEASKERVEFVVKLLQESHNIGYFAPTQWLVAIVSRSLTEHNLKNNLSKFFTQILLPLNDFQSVDPDQKIHLLFGLTKALDPENALYMFNMLHEEEVLKKARLLEYFAPQLIEFQAALDDSKSFLNLLEFIPSFKSKPVVSFSKFTQKWILKILKDNSVSQTHEFFQWIKRSNSTMMLNRMKRYNFATKSSRKYVLDNSI